MKKIIRNSCFTNIFSCLCYVFIYYQRCEIIFNALEIVVIKTTIRDVMPTKLVFNYSWRGTSNFTSELHQVQFLWNLCNILISTIFQNICKCIFDKFITILFPLVNYGVHCFLRENIFLKIFF